MTPLCYPLRGNPNTEVLEDVYSGDNSEDTASSFCRWQKDQRDLSGFGCIAEYSSKNTPKRSDRTHLQTKLAAIAPTRRVCCPSGRASGTGLGLSIVKKLADLQKIKVSLKSEKNIGTTFVLTIPAAEPLIIPT